MREENVQAVTASKVEIQNSTDIKEKEATTMNNKTNNAKETNGMIKENTLFGPTPDTEILNLIPKDEQAVDTKNNTFHEISDVHRDLIAEIPDDEREDISESVVTNIDLIREQGGFSTVQGMQGFVSDHGAIFYACIHEDSNHNKFIEYCQQYQNGKISAKMSIPYADLILAANYNFNSKAISETSIRNDVAKFLLRISKDYCNKLDYPRECLNITNLLMTIINNFSTLPMISDVSKYENPEILYNETVRNIKKLGPALIDEHKAYYTLDRDQIDAVADGMGMKRDELLKMLKESHMLYLAPSSNGYQTCVRFKANKGLSEEFLGESHTEWCYCVLKMEYLAEQRKMKSRK